MSDASRFVMTVLMAGWALSFAYAFYFFATEPPTGDGFTRGLNRVSGYLGWQGIAGTFAIAIWGVGRRWQAGSGVRRLSWVPILLALAQVLAIVALIVWANFAG
ncbi:MAG: hypothetical protein AAF762_00570 [Pseudomonadota bacterium]